jgi:hypothetical protein
VVVEELLQLLVSEINAKLFKAVVLIKKTIFISFSVFVLREIWPRTEIEKVIATPK